MENLERNDFISYLIILCLNLLDSHDYELTRELFHWVMSQLPNPGGRSLFGSFPDELKVSIVFFPL